MLVSRFVLLGLFFYINNVAANSFEVKLEKAANERTLHNIKYDGSYFSIDYPNGDVPNHIGVCTDVVIRAYRALGVDLQKQVHEDMSLNFSAYPSKRIWGLSKPDKNIDHRRVPNLRVFFSRHGQELPVSTAKQNYLPGDIVTWLLPGNLPHIGIVVEGPLPNNKSPFIVHNIGAGPKKENVIFDYKITGHYHYHPDK